jgi:glycosyltransferase involved in cell wall biosynthesis
MQSGANKKVVFFDFPFQGRVGDYEICSFDVSKYLGKWDHFDWNELLTSGLRGFFKRQGIALYAHIVDELYRERDPAYFRLLREFMETHGDADIILMGQANFLHPEFLFHELKGTTKILGFVDDPVSTYRAGISYLWAFDGAFYISPSYDERTLFPDALEKWGCRSHYWWPLVTRKFARPESVGDAFFSQRNVDLLYIGLGTRWKIPRLAKVLNRYKGRFVVHGRWRMGGYVGFVRSLMGKPAFFRRVTSVSEARKFELMWRTKIGLNMHWSDTPRETGNMRMYELCAHGVCQVCDTAGVNAHAKIFDPATEVVFYKDIDEAIEKIDWLLGDEKSRAQIARAGFERYWRDYDWEDNLLALLDWASSLRSESGSGSRPTERVSE